MIKEDVDTKVLDDEPIGGAVGDQMNFDALIRRSYT